MRSPEKANPSPDSQAAMTAMLEEYRVLYSLVLFRLSALDRRVPVVGASITAFVAAVTSLPTEMRVVVLLAVPLAVVWLLRVTINHARSFEDALRRIEVLEMEINLRAGCSAMAFQHRHPSRGSVVGGRTGHETIRSVWTAGMLMLGVCAYFFLTTSGVDAPMQWVYASYLGMAVTLMLVSIVRWRRYRYRPGAVLGVDVR